MDESRKQFEDWVKFHLGDDWSEVSMHTANGGANYKDSYVDLAWIAWKASRGAIEIDAPAEPFYPMQKENSPTDHYHYGRQSIISRVRASGIKVKE
ncbi:hypothetical protein ACEV7C_08985 [Enterobacter ludwigii]|uniref:hypothetical protein n=1 Tax=Enterobacter ludwigii TaxID=299767 RepID=UPI003BEEBADA